MKITTDSMELRVLELEDTVRLLAQIVGTLSEMMGNLNEISKAHAGMLRSVLTALEGAKDGELPSPEVCRG